MSLSKEELDNLVRLIGLTKDRELNCEQCLSVVAEFAEQQLEGKSVPDSLRAVEHHLSVCGDCREEYRMLKEALKGLGERGSDR